MKKTEDNHAGEGYIVIAGKIEARKCKCCGHHELCLTGSEDEGTIPLQPKDIIELTITENEYERRLEEK